MAYLIGEVDVLFPVFIYFALLSYLSYKRLDTIGTIMAYLIKYTSLNSFYFIFDKSKVHDILYCFITESSKGHS